MTGCSNSSLAAGHRSKAFSSEVGTGSREENASKQSERSVLIYPNRSFGSITGRTATGGMAQPTFFEQPPSSTLTDIAALTQARLVDASRGGRQVRGLASLDEAGPMHLTFFDNLKSAGQLASTKAGACLVNERFEASVPAHVAVLRAVHPFREFVKIARALHSDALRPQSWFCNAGIAEPGLRAKSVAMQRARNLHKFAERMDRAQNGNVGGDTGLESLIDQTRPRLRRRELAGVFQVVEERQMHRPGFVERSQPPDLPAAPRCIDQTRLRQRGDIGQRRRRRLFEKCRLRHPTRRGPAGDRTKASVLINQNRTLALF